VRASEGDQGETQERGGAYSRVGLTGLELATHTADKHVATVTRWCLDPSGLTSNPRATRQPTLTPLELALREHPLLAALKPDR